MVTAPSRLSTRGVGDIDRTLRGSFISQALFPYNNTPWGVATGYTLFSNTTKSANKTDKGGTKMSTSSELGFGVYCLQCHVELSLSFRVVVDWTLANGISKAVITLTGKGEMQIVIGLEAHCESLIDTTRQTFIMCGRQVWVWGEEAIADSKAHVCHRPVASRIFI